jgi:hypothetical protein
MITMIKFLKLFLLTSILACLLKAGDRDPADSVSALGGWFGMGLGKCYVDISGHYYLSLIYKENLFTFRYLRAKETSFNIGGGETDSPPLSIEERGFLYGRCYRKEYLLLSISAGIGHISGVERGRKISEKHYEQINISAYGIPFEAKFRLNMGFLGFGGGWYGNINSQKFLSGGMIELSIGVY